MRTIFTLSFVLAAAVLVAGQEIGVPVWVPGEIPTANLDKLTLIHQLPDVEQNLTSGTISTTPRGGSTIEVKDNSTLPDHLVTDEVELASTQRSKPNQVGSEMPAKKRLVRSYIVPKKMSGSEQDVDFVSISTTPRGSDTLEVGGGRPPLLLDDEVEFASDSAARIPASINVKRTGKSNASTKATGSKPGPTRRPSPFHAPKSHRPHPNGIGQKTTGGIRPTRPQQHPNGIGQFIDIEYLIFGEHKTVNTTQKGAQMIEDGAIKAKPVYIGGH